MAENENKKGKGAKRIIIAYIILNVAIIGMISVRWREQSWELRRRSDRAALGRIARALEAYVADNGGYLPSLENDTELKSVLYPRYVRDRASFICQRAAAKYKTGPDDVNMRFRFNMALNGMHVNDIELGEIVVYELFWPERPKNEYCIVRDEGEYLKSEIPLGLFSAVSADEKYKITFSPETDDNWIQFKGYYPIP